MHDVVNEEYRLSQRSAEERERTTHVRFLVGAVLLPLLWLGLSNLADPPTSHASRATRP